MTHPDHHHAAQARWRASSAWEHHQQHPHGMTRGDRLTALREEWRQQGPRGLVWDIAIVTWNLVNLWRHRRA